MSLHRVKVTADSTLEAQSPGATTGFSTLTLENGTASIGGVNDGVSFSNTVIPNDLTTRTVGLDLYVPTDIGPIDGQSGIATFSKGGPEDLVLEDEHTGLVNVTFEAREGRLIGLHGSNPFSDNAHLAINGGELVLASKGGDVTYDNALEVKADGTLTAGTGDQATADAGPLTVTLGNPDPSARGITLSGGTANIRATGDYSLRVAGPVSGSGNAIVTEGNVTFGGSVQTTGTLEVAGGHLVTELPGSVDALVINGGTMDTGGNELTVTRKLKLGVPTLRSDVPMIVSGSNLPVAADITINGGTVDMQGTIVANYDLPTIAYEGFEYPAGALSGNNGGSGFTTSWATAGWGPIAVDDPGLEYQDADENVLQSFGGTSRTFGWDWANRTLNPVAGLTEPDGRFGVDGTTIWMSLLVNFVADDYFPPDNTDSMSFFKLVDPNPAAGDPSELLFGRFWTGDVGAELESDRRWGVTNDIYWDRTSVPLTEQSLVLIKLEFLPGMENLTIWMNPLLDAEPDPATADINKATENFRFSAISMDGDSQVQYDEFRLGTSFAEVTPQPNRGPLELALTNFTVTEDAVFNMQTDQDGLLGNVTLAAGKTLTLSGQSANINDLNLGDGSTFDGGLVVRGTIGNDGQAGTSTIFGLLEMDEETPAALHVEIAGDQHDNVQLDGSFNVPSGAFIAGSLSAAGLSPRTSGGSAVWGDAVLTVMEVIDAESETGILGEFGELEGTTIPTSYGVVGTLPNEGDYLGAGMWFGNATDDPVGENGVYYTPMTVGIGVFQAAPGDTDGNRKVEGQDILNILQAGLFGDGVTPEANWGNGDFNSDSKISGEDILALLGTGLFGDGTYPDSAAGAAGADVKLVVTGDGLVIDTGGATVTGFVLSSESGILTGDDADNLGLFQEDTDEAISGTFAMSLKGEHDLGDVLGETDVDLGGDLSLAYTIAGIPGVFTASVVVPEPGTLMLLLSGLVGLLIWRRRK